MSLLLLIGSINNMNPFKDPSNINILGEEYKW